jgi:MFS family permease
MRAQMKDPELAQRRRWLTLGVVCMSLMVIGLDNTILNVALPTLGRDLHATTSSLQWIVDVYILVFAGLLLTAGSLTDRFGRYKGLTFGLAVFGVGSLASALSGSTGVLIATRAFMGIGGAFIMPATLSIITNLFREPAERAKAIGVWAGVSALGVGIGPVAGGFLLSHFYWGSVFFVNVPIVVVALVAGYFLVPDSRDPSAPRLDPVGALLSSKRRRVAGGRPPSSRRSWWVSRSSAGSCCGSCVRRTRCSTCDISRTPASRPPARRSRSRSSPCSGRCSC